MDLHGRDLSLLHMHLACWICILHAAGSIPPTSRSELHFQTLRLVGGVLSTNVGVIFQALRLVGGVLSTNVGVIFQALRLVGGMMSTKVGVTYFSSASAYWGNAVDQRRSYRDRVLLGLLGGCADICLAVL